VESGWLLIPLRRLWSPRSRSLLKLTPGVKCGRQHVSSQPRHQRGASDWSYLPRSSHASGGYWSNDPDHGVTFDTEQIGTKTYLDSVRFECLRSDFDDTVAYDVAGYKTLSAVIGVPSDASDAAGRSATIKFLKDGTTTQLGSEASLALDRPQTVNIDLQGASQVVINCAGDAQFDIVLGSATLLPS
jgi:hypothetical protein